MNYKRSMFKTLLLPILTIALFNSVNAKERNSKKTSVSATSSSSQYKTSLEQRILQLTNIERKKRGLTQVKFHNGLAQISRKHSNFLSTHKARHNMATNGTAHAGFNKRYNLVRRKFKFDFCSENVHATWSKRGDLAKRIVTGWMNSPGHRKIMLAKDFRYCGVGVRQAGGGTYSTMLMGVNRGGRGAPLSFR